MDSSKHNLGKEECNSSESGWTTYIASPMQEDDNDCSDNDNDHNPIANDGNADDYEQLSDDSMASDASSGPHYPPNRGTTSFKHYKGNHFKNRSPAAKPKKKEKKEKKNDGNSTQKHKRLSANRKYSK